MRPAVAMARSRSMKATVRLAGCLRHRTDGADGTGRFGAGSRLCGSPTGRWGPNPSVFSGLPVFVVYGEWPAALAAIERMGGIRR